jgi:predicted SAM-dependent methyltransferase
MSFAINRNYLTHGLDLASLTGIEIGPLVNPVVTRAQSDVHYVDRASTEELQEWYSRDEKINVDEIMQIDFIWGDQSLAEATGGTEQFDYCIASHVIEHIPDLITWLNEISSVLKVGGVACFAVPDKRYTFDYLRPLTTTAEQVDNYLNKLRKPSYKHIYDHFSNFVDLDIQEAWSEGFDGSKLVPKKSPRDTFLACQDALENDKYIDSHCSVFTEDSFIALLEKISELGLLNFKLRRRFSVNRGMFEFFVQLEKIDDGLDESQKHQAFLGSLKSVEASHLEFDFCCNKVTQTKLYLDTGIGFSEVESLVLNYPSADSNVRLKFPLPNVNDIKLRFDPADFEVDFSISNAALTIDGHSSPINLDSILPLSDIQSTNVENDILILQSTHEALDPAVTFCT